MSKKDPIRELCKSSCEIIPIEQKEPEKLKYANYIKRTTFKRIYEGSPYDLILKTPEFDTLEIQFTIVGTPLYYEVYLRQLPKYTSLPPYTFMTNQGKLSGLQINTFYEVDVVAYYISDKKFHLNRKRIFNTLNEGPPANMVVTTPTGLVHYTGSLFFNLNFTDASGSVLKYSVDTYSSDISFTQDVFANQNNIIPNLNRNETYTLELTSFYYEGVYNPDYTLIQNNVQMINETPVSDISFSNITGHDVTVRFVSAIGDLNDVSYTVLFNDISQVTFGSLESSIDLSFQDLSHNNHYDVKVVSHYKTNNNSYLLDSSFNTLNETSVSNFIVVVNGPKNVKVDFEESPNFTVNDTYTLTLIDLSDNQTIGSETDISGNTSFPIDISSTFGELLDVDNSYNLLVTSTYAGTGHIYNTQFEFKTLNEGIIDSASVIENDRTGASVGLDIISFNGSSPVEYVVRFVSNSENISFTRTPTNLFFDNIFQKNTVYKVFIKSIYDTNNRYSKATFDLSFQTRDEEALSDDLITITPYGTHVYIEVNYGVITDLSTDFEYEIINQVTNVIDVANSVTSSNNVITIDTLQSHGHKLFHNTFYRLKLVSKFGDPVREYYTFKNFNTLDEFPLYITLSDNLDTTGRSSIFDISGTEDISRNIDYVFYDVSLSDGQDFSGNYNIFPILFNDLSANFDYTIFIRSTFNSSDNTYDISYDFQTLNESELEKIEFKTIDDTSYNPYSDILIDTLYRNPGNKHAVATLYPPSGTIETLYVQVQVESAAEDQDLILDVSYDQFVATQKISGLMINTKYVIYTTTEYTTGNRYDISQTFTTLNEKEIDISNDFYVYTTDDNLAIDFVETGDGQTYTVLLPDISFNGETNPPLDLNIPGLRNGETYDASINTVYDTGNTYKSLNFRVIPGFKSEQYIRDGLFNIGDSNINTRGFSTTLPSSWSSSSSVVIATLNTDNSGTAFYKERPVDSTSLFSAVLYLPSNLSAEKVLRQSIYENTGPNSDIDNNLYEGKYAVSFFAANHKIAGEAFSFGNVTDPTIRYEVKLVNTAPFEEISSVEFITTANDISYRFIDISFVVPTSYNNVEFQIKRTGNEKNNLYIMDVSMISVE